MVFICFPQKTGVPICLFPKGARIISLLLKGKRGCSKTFGSSSFIICCSLLPSFKYEADDSYSIDEKREGFLGAKKFSLAHYFLISSF